MITIKTKTGKEFTSDLVTETDNPERLYVFVRDSTMLAVATAFADPQELPLEEHSAYTEVCSISLNHDGNIIVCLKKGG